MKYTVNTLVNDHLLNVTGKTMQLFGIVLNDEILLKLGVLHLLNWRFAILVVNAFVFDIVDSDIVVPFIPHIGVKDIN